MIYTPEHYEQDKGIAIYIYNKYFKGHYMKDDLIQIAIIELWNLRLKRNYNYVRCACTTALNRMISFLRKENRNFAESLFDNVGNEHDLRLIDVLELEQATAHDYCEYSELVKKIIPLPMLLSDRDRRIIALHLKHYTQKEIAWRVGISQQYVSIVINRFRENARQILEGGNQE